MKAKPKKILAKKIVSKQPVAKKPVSVSKKPEKTFGYRFLDC
jgi:hypothetical protein